MFLKVQRKRAADGSEALYASVVENSRRGGRTVQRTVLNIGRVGEDQVPYLRAAWSERKPRLVWDDDPPLGGE
jgi:hypothetical protein